MQGKDHRDRELAIGDPVGRRQADGLKPALLTANRAVLEQCGPGQRKGPRRQHVGYDQRRREPTPPEHVGPRNQPGQNATHNQRHRDRAHRDFQRIHEWLPEQVLRHGRGKGARQIIEREAAQVVLHTALVAELHGRRITQDGKDRHHDQIKEQGGHQNADDCRRLSQRHAQAIGPACVITRSGWRQIRIRHGRILRACLPKRQLSQCSANCPPHQRAQQAHWNCFAYKGIFLRKPLPGNDTSA